MSQLLDCFDDGNGENMISEGAPITQEDWITLGKNYIAETESDMVNSPPHYNKFGIEVIDILEMYFKDKPLLFNAGKYLLRCQYKGHEDQDLAKAVWYIERHRNALRTVSRLQGDQS